ncbi:unnamed protein product [Notodromas monacha]|uniref:E3 ubiquitin-protein ligase n=1 Tax=Notodromas monacha TaxID=399045 RepID=A0A7R9BXN2_9CRUS|nr:unnamed protein product [Notodromas monacha]CAG0922704.1 unnamed protein product [Notodromas monacha]
MADNEECANRDGEESSDLDCAVCLQSCVHPVKLPCGHHFCYLCVKGVALLSKKCAMCRQEIPWECLDNPELLREEEFIRSASETSAEKWYYEGRNGWWQYDDRTSAELENAFTKNEAVVEVLVAGFVYIVDLIQMTQCRKNGMGRVRSVKRDSGQIPNKIGVAGLRLRPGGAPNNRRNNNRDADGGENPPPAPPVRNASMLADVDGASDNQLQDAVSTRFRQLRLESTTSPPPRRRRPRE